MALFSEERREMGITECPASRSTAVSRVPTRPEAPVMAIVWGATLILRETAHSEKWVTAARF
jgi:hypothetical protein